MNLEGPIAWRGRLFRFQMTKDDDAMFSELTEPQRAPAADFLAHR